MVQRLTYRKRHSYATKSNQTRVVKTPVPVHQEARERTEVPSHREEDPRNSTPETC
ncbi:60S ribosomal protein L34-3 [Zea mays]|uniref:60S ribosomal protein L34-3 n=1 Tax=Zea mays TaxID=4577 RepID=A0A1D6PW09_MAIZE|nr:60S ribosomal protein L34-3 [Zea mays]